MGGAALRVFPWALDESHVDLLTGRPGAAIINYILGLLTNLLQHTRMLQIYVAHDIYILLSIIG